MYIFGLFRLGKRSVPSFPRDITPSRTMPSTSIETVNGVFYSKLGNPVHSSYLIILTFDLLLSVSKPTVTNRSFLVKPPVTFNISQVFNTGLNNPF